MLAWETPETNLENQIKGRAKEGHFLLARAEVTRLNETVYLSLFQRKTGKVAPVIIHGPDKDVQALLTGMVGAIDKTLQGVPAKSAEVLKLAEPASQDAGEAKPDLLRELIVIADRAYDEHKETDILLDIYDYNKERYDGLAEFIVREIQSVNEGETDRTEMLGNAVAALGRASEELMRVLSALDAEYYNELRGGR